jgi:tRNA pseudouridine38-40 synthase
VEGEIRRGLAQTRRITEGGPVRLEVASRTDRGVSARANVLALESPLPGSVLLRALNGIDPHMFFTAATEAPAGFRVRRATRRVYRYYDPHQINQRARTREATALFTGRIDVRSFGRAIPQNVVTLRAVESVELRKVPGGCEIVVSAPSFVWGMVRKIVGALHEVDEGRLTIPRLRAALEGSVRLTLPLAPSEPLVLWEVEYPIEWKFEWDGPNRGQVVARRQRADRIWVDRTRMAALPG